MEESITDNKICTDQVLNLVSAFNKLAQHILVIILKCDQGIQILT